MAGKWNLENGMYAYLLFIRFICYAVHLFLIYLPFCLFICRLHYWEEALLPRDPRWWKAWALLFVLVHIWWDNAPYLFGWVKHNLCCSNGQLRRVVAGYWTCSGHWVFVYHWDVLNCLRWWYYLYVFYCCDQCPFCGSQTFPWQRNTRYIYFCTVLIYEEEKKHCKTKLIYQPNAHLVPRNKLIISQVTWWPLLRVYVPVEFNRKDFMWIHSII